MADAVSTTPIEDGERQLVVQLTNLSDSTGETKVTKIDASALATNKLGKSCNEVPVFIQSNCQVLNQLSLNFNSILISKS